MNFANHYLKLIAVIFLFMSNVLFAQEDSSLSKAKSLTSQHKYKAALKILETWTNTHQDLNSLWLYAETLHSAKKYSKSQEIYKKAINKFPNHNILQLDYANKLAEAGKFSEAITKLKPFANIKDENQLFTLQTMAKVYYWQGAYDKASTTINNALKLNANDKTSKELSEKIELARKNWVGLNLLYSQDNQPQSIIRTEAEGGYYLNDFASFGAKIDMPTYNLNNKNYLGIGFKVFNILNFHKLKAKSHIEVGLEKLPNDKLAFNGLILLKKHIYKHLGVEVNTSYQPNLLTNTAISKNLMELKYGLAFTWNNPNGFTARTAIDMNQFLSEDNHYYTASIWALSPKLKLSFFDFRVGYGFSYSDSKLSTYTANNSLDSVIQTNWDNPKLQIDGYYNPFFTPSKQMVNSAIVSIDAKPIEKLKINLTGNLGFYSTTDNPYLKLSLDSANNYFIDQEFSEEIYFPLEIKSSISYNINTNFVIHAVYKYQSTKYYNIHLGGLKAKFLF